MGKKTAFQDIEVDFGFWNSRLTGTIDVYNKKTTDLLISRDLQDRQVSLQPIITKDH